MEKIIYFNTDLQKELVRPLIIRLLKSLDLKRLMNYMLIRFQHSLRMVRVFGYPYDVIIDPCNICMLHCPLCPTGLGETSRRKAIMKFELFKKIIDEIGDYVISVNFTNWGEPLLNRDLPKMVKYCKKVKLIPLVRFDTNLNVDLDEKFCDEILLSGLDILSISIDGVSQKTYEVYRRNGDLAKVLRNIKLLVSRRKNLGLKKPYFIWQFLVFKHNIHEIPLAIRTAHEVGVDMIKIASGRVYMGDEAFRPIKELMQISKNILVQPGSYWSLYTKDLKKRARKRFCDWLWKRIVINPDGSVSPCCAYYPQKYDFGDIVHTSIKELWNSNKYKEARKSAKSRDHVRHVREANVCAICTLLGNFVDV